MQLITDFDQEQVTWGSPRVWRAIRQAVGKAPGMTPSAAYSVGDVLTYVTDRASALADERFVARRRYWTVLACLEGQARVEVAPLSDLEVDQAYRDSTDREYLRGRGTEVVLEAGAGVGVPPHHAVRVLPGEARLVELHVAVEGFTPTSPRHFRP
nr:hypothetical protein [Actinomyces sp.]